MANYGFGSRKLAIWVFLAVLTVGGGVAWIERSTLLEWICVHRLANADEATRDRWVERVVNLNDGAPPILLECLRRPEPAAARNARAGLDRLVQTWGRGESRTADLLHLLARNFHTLSEPGQVQTLEAAVACCALDGGEPASANRVAASRMLGEAARGRAECLQPPMLELANALLASAPSAESLAPCREAIRGCLQASEPALRIRAVQLALVPGLDLFESIVPLLRDGSAEVRQAAMLAVGPAQQQIRDESLLPSLHDPDPEVRRLCEVALRGRGLSTEQIRLGRLMTDPQPANRLCVLDHLFEESELDPGLWLRQLSHDPSPAVRAAAVRAICQQTSVDLSDRLDQMARSDPSPTVVELARYYLRAPRANASRSER